MGRSGAVGRAEIPPGTLYMLILDTLAGRGPMHGYGIAERREEMRFHLDMRAARNQRAGVGAWRWASAARWRSRGCSAASFTA